jgi:NAD-dependent SIR2 family protein deacetylase
MENITKAVDAINEADALLITSGAGMGVDSGLPDFRGREGFWKAYPPIAKLGISFSEMANPHWFNSDPYLAWAFYGHRYNLYKETKPHEGFDILLKLAQRMEKGHFVFTSNVDGHFQKAGFNEDNITECHGSINHLQCSKPCNHKICDGTGFNIKVDMEQFKAIDPLPHCPDCGSVARPNILMFGDWSWISGRTDMQEDRLSEWLQGIQGSRLVIIEMGAGTSVATVRYKSEQVASYYNGTLIRINPRDYQVPKNHISIPTGALEGLKMLADGINL